VRIVDGTRSILRGRRARRIPGRPEGRARLGIAATRKLGPAVVRNRAKRVVREVFRRNKPPGGFDIVVIPRRELLEADYAHVEAEFLSILARRGSFTRAGSPARGTPAPDGQVRASRGDATKPGAP